MPIDEITDLHLPIRASLSENGTARTEAFREALPSVRQTSLASFLPQYNRVFPDDRARLPTVFISQATH